MISLVLPREQEEEEVLNQTGCTMSMILMAAEVPLMKESWSTHQVRANLSRDNMKGFKINMQVQVTIAESKSSPQG